MNDAVLAFGLRYLQHHSSPFGDEKGTPKATRLSQARSMEGETPSLRYTDPFNYDYILSPLHQIYHWSLVIIAHPARIIEGHPVNLDLTKVTPSTTPKGKLPIRGALSDGQAQSQELLPKLPDPSPPRVPNNGSSEERWLACQSPAAFTAKRPTVHGLDTH
ncbi:hypothetical protein V8E36_007859 [Tilletia maclaganii]